MLDEQSVQFPGRLVAHLDGADLQNLAGLMEPGELESKHRANSARSGLAIEMDRLALGCDRSLYDVLSATLPETDGRRTDHAGQEAGTEGRKQAAVNGDRAIGSATQFRITKFEYRNKYEILMTKIAVECVSVI